ncbi:HD-GYP domain-containing protein [Salipaludibacillus aurantiacus]|uniref:HD-GYP domain, c-di-GMP phosphodiesterase class II (Or its inactivated variant) n=1 Tax=Salipaludibacillus aurantiacus TaxID=1601833 RepID=A0A1H9VN86_9BACI|nr:HD-GYP domain-containing protein [Salipaludibacillus aurantiacus]SES23008.1 HD-GYP domain, c-di-GMP phosphodiesterase class II (or its inactivated variant) [Salipaludibacillus aurantiacus]
MKVKPIYLVPGCMLAEDVYKHSNTPLMRKKTVLTEDYIQILQKFLVEHVQVESTLINGDLFTPKERIMDNDVKTESNLVSQQPLETSNQTIFTDRYLSGVQQYKKMFKNWQGGAKVDAYEIRKVFLPLYDTNPSKDELLHLHNYTTKHDYLYYHSVAVSIFSSMLGKRLGLKNGEVIQLGIAGLLADCGMAKVPFKVFEKKGPLTAEEYKEVKKHPVTSYRMLEKVPGLSKKAMLGIVQHHEREDGSGYPLKVKGMKLHQYAKIIAIADVFHAMASERYYRPKKNPYRVIAFLKQDQFGKLDHVLLNEFIHMMLDLSIGRKVRLNNGCTGEVLFQNKHYPTSPTIKVDGKKIIDLAKHPELIIEEELPWENQVESQELKE